MKCFLDGRWADGADVPAAYGLDEDTQRRSVFTTLGVAHDTPLFTKLHLARLRYDAETVNLTLADDDRIIDWLFHGLNLNALRDGVIRIVAAPGDRDRCATFISFDPPRGAPRTVDLLLVEQPSVEPRSIKRLWRKDWDEAVQRARDAGCTDVLGTIQGKLAETSICNVFVVFGNEVVTPPADGFLLPGIARGRLLAQGIASAAPVTVSDLERADAVFVTNSVRGVAGVDRILQPDGRIIYEAAGGGSGVIRQAREVWDRLLGREIVLNDPANHARRPASGG